jgi:CHASE3 domain sensor protein
MYSILRTKRLVWAFAVAIVTVVVTFTYLSARRYVAAVESVQRTLEVSGTIDQIVATILEEESRQRGYLLTGDRIFLEPSDAGRARAAADLRRLKEVTDAGSVQRSWVEELERLIHEKQAFVDHLIQLRQSGAADATLRIVKTGQGRQLMD